MKESKHEKNNTINNEGYLLTGCSSLSDNQIIINESAEN